MLASATLATAQEEGVTDDEIIIGNVLPMTSSAALVGRAAHFGSVIAAREANANGGVNGRQITIRTEDDGYVPARTVQGLRKLMDEGLFGLIGTGAGAGTAAILPILEEESIPAIVSLLAPAGGGGPDQALRLHARRVLPGPALCPAQVHPRQ